MRNLKKFLALVLAMMMVMGLMVTVNAASISDYSDANKITPTYYEAVEVLSALGVFEGDASGFRPGDTITRGEAAAVLYRIMSGDTNKNSKLPDIYKDFCEFTDVIGTGYDWAAGYIGYAASQSLVVGDGNGKFRPGDPVTGYEMQIMLMRALGYDKQDEFKGSTYKTESTKWATSLGIISNIPAGTLGLGATREMVAEIAFRTINVGTVRFNNSLIAPNYNPTGTTLAESNFGLKYVEGEITEVNREKGSAVFTPYGDETAEITQTGRRQTYTVIGLDTEDVVTWEKVGHTAGVWGTKVGSSVDANTYQAITDVDWISTVLYANNGKASYDKDNNRENIEDIANTQKVPVVPIQTDKYVKDSITSNWSNVLGAYVTSVAPTARIYFNGERLPVYANGKSGQDSAGTDNSFTGGYYYNTSTDRIEYASSKGAKVYRTLDIVNGVSVEFVDSDNGGEAEVIIVKEYTVATLAGDTTGGINTGHNAIIKDHYYFNAYNTDSASGNNPRTDVDATEIKYHVDDVVAPETLTVGELVTYVDYKGEAYVTIPEAVPAKLTRITFSRNNQEDTIRLDIGEYEKAGWTIVPGTYYAQEYYVKDYSDPVLSNCTDYLSSNAYVGSDYDFYFDAYDNIIAVTEPVTLYDYLFIAKIDHSSSVRNTALALVVYPDGTVEEVTIALGTNQDFNTLKEHVYRYTVNDDGYIVLGDSIINDTADAYKGLNSVCETNGYIGTGTVVGNYGTEISGAFNNKTVSMTDKYGKTVKLDNDTVVMDVRGITYKDSKIADAKIYNGRSKLPTLSGVTMHAILDKNDYVIVAFLTAGSTSSSTSYARNIVVYQTDTWHYLGRVNGVDMYSMPVIDLDSGEWDEVTLTYAQLCEIIGSSNISNTRALADSGHGVGVYYFNKDGVTLDGYETFAETWVNVKWSTGTLEELDDSGDFVRALPYGEVPFWTFDIAKGQAYDYEPNRGTDTKKAWLDKDPKTGEVLGIYIVDGQEADVSNADSTVDNVDKNGNVLGTWYVKKGYVTTYEAKDLRTVWVYDNGNRLIGTANYAQGSTVLTVKLNGDMRDSDNIKGDKVQIKYNNSDGPYKTWADVPTWTSWGTAGTNYSVEYDRETKTMTITMLDNGGKFIEWLEVRLTEAPYEAQPENPTDGPTGNGPSLGDSTGSVTKPGSSSDPGYYDDILDQTGDLYKDHGILSKTENDTITITVYKKIFDAAVEDADPATGNTDKKTAKMVPGQMYKDEDASVANSDYKALVVGVGFEPHDTVTGTELHTFKHYVVKKGIVDITNEEALESTDTLKASHRQGSDGNASEDFVYEFFTIANWVDGKWVLRTDNPVWTIKYQDGGSWYQWHIKVVINTTDATLPS